MMRSSPSDRDREREREREQTNTMSSITSSVSVARTHTSSLFGISSRSSKGGKDKDKDKDKDKERKKKTASAPVPLPPAGANVPPIPFALAYDDPYASYIEEHDWRPRAISASATSTAHNVARSAAFAAAGGGDGEAGTVTARTVTRSVDGGGDIWEHEQETGVVDVIPQLRNLKASKS
ncbi:hypothetical protein B0H34DRAFT_712612 [Crassisporium funariophilum]|nr:hypothetical protein B0H34DRAFT_712612 [Crassisporium funariophilum]